MTGGRRLPGRRSRSLLIAESRFLQLDRIDDGDLGQLGLSGGLKQEQQGFDPPPGGERQALDQLLKRLDLIGAGRQRFFETARL